MRRTHRVGSQASSTRRHHSCSISNRRSNLTQATLPSLLPSEFPEAAHFFRSPLIIWRTALVVRPGMQALPVDHPTAGLDVHPGMWNSPNQSSPTGYQESMTGPPLDQRYELSGPVRVFGRDTSVNGHTLVILDVLSSLGVGPRRICETFSRTTTDGRESFGHPRAGSGTDGAYCEGRRCRSPELEVAWHRLQAQINHMKHRHL